MVSLGRFVAAVLVVATDVAALVTGGVARGAVDVASGLGRVVVATLADAEVTVCPAMVGSVQNN